MGMMVNDPKNEPSATVVTTSVHGIFQSMGVGIFLQSSRPISTLEDRLLNVNVELALTLLHQIQERLGYSSIPNNFLLETPADAENVSIWKMRKKDELPNAQDS